MDFLKNLYNNHLRPLLGGRRKRSATEYEPEITDDEEITDIAGPSKKKMKSSCSPCASSDDDVIVTDPVVSFHRPRPLKPYDNIAHMETWNAQHERSSWTSTSFFASPKASIRLPPPFLRSSLNQQQQRHFGSQTPFRTHALRMASYTCTRADTVRWKEKQEYKNLILRWSTIRPFFSRAKEMRPSRAMASGSIVLDKAPSPYKSACLQQNNASTYEYRQSNPKQRDVELIDISGDDGDNLNVSTGNAVALRTPSAITSASYAPATSTPFPQLTWKPGSTTTLIPSSSKSLTVHSHPYTSVGRKSESSIKLDELGERVKSILDSTLGTLEDPIVIADENGEKTKKKETPHDDSVILSSGLLTSPHINSLELSLLESPYASKEWLQSRIREQAVASRERAQQIEREEKTLEILRKESTIDRDISEFIRRNLTLTDIIELEEEKKAEELPDITEEMQLIIDDARAPGMSMQQVIVRTQNNVEVTKSDIKSLAPLQWLNDNVIDAYMDLIVRRSKVNTDWPLVYAFTTFFYPKLLNEGYSNTLKRWTRKVDVFSYDLLIFPIHLGIHWCLAAADKRSKTIRYYDSLGGKNHQCCRVLLDYLCKEYAERKKTTFKAWEWTLDIVEDTPQQQNGSDCGMFSCKVAEYLSRDSELTFKQDDMNYFRERMIYELVSQNILHP